MESETKVHRRLAQIAGTAVGLLTLVLCGTAHAASNEAAYPVKPIRVLVPSPPGSGTDVMARAVTQKLSADLGQSVVADNRAGAAGAIAVETLATAMADGYTLGVLSAQNITGMLTKTVPVDIPNAVAPIALMITQPYLLVVTPSLPVKNVKELVALAKAQRLVYASSGVGSVVHLGMEMFALAAGIEMTHVPYKGSGLSMIDLMSGRVQLAITNALTGARLVRSGKIHGLAVTSAHRAEALPELPTVAESGFPGYEVGSWYGLVAPKGVPPSIIARLNRAVAVAITAPDVRERFANDGAQAAAPNTPEQFRAHISNDIKRWSAFLSRAHVKLE